MLRKRLAVLVAMVVMLVSMFAVTAPVSADQVKGNNGNHFGDIRNPDNGEKIGQGSGGGKFNNNGQHNGGGCTGCTP